MPAQTTIRTREQAKARTRTTTTRPRTSRLTDADRDAIEAARQVLREVDTTEYGMDATALAWDISALGGAAHVILAIIDKIGRES